MTSNSDTEFSVDSSPPIVVSLSGNGVDVVDRTSLDAVDSEELILETDHESRVTEDETIHRFTVVLRDGGPNVDLQRSWEDDDEGVSDDGKNVSMDHRSWGDDS